MELEYGRVKSHGSLITWIFNKWNLFFVIITRVVFLVVNGIFFLSTDFLGVKFPDFLFLLLGCSHLAGHHNSGNGI
jgi:hypothetical protein